MKRYLLISIFILFTFTLIFGETITIDMKDAVLGRGFPELVEIAGKFYVLDKTQRKVFVFNDKKFLFCFGQAGQNRELRDGTLKFGFIKKTKREE